MNDVQVVTIIIALYGAILSTLHIVHLFLEKKKNLKVTIMVVNKRMDIGMIKIPCLSLVCSNIGKQPIKIVNFGIYIPQKKWRLSLPLLDFSEEKLPKKLFFGDNFVIDTPLNKFGEEIKKEGYSDTVKIVGFVIDNAEKRYYSKKYKFHLNRLILG